MKVRIAGVPEHFNLPWHLAIEENAFSERGIKLEWTDVPEGTGKLCNMLRENKTDLAVILTEGIVRDITLGNPSKIIQIYIESPLVWGIHVNANSSYRDLKDLENTRAAISRFGSGSHLMAFLNAAQQGWDISALEFEEVNDLDGAIAALDKNSAQYFMWEHFTTKPLVDKGIFRRVADCPTPWPCFVIACNDKILNEAPGVIKHLLEVINTYTADFRDIPSIDRTIANRYGQKQEDIREWLSLTRWSARQLAPEMLNTIQNKLMQLDLIQEKLLFEHVVTTL